MRSLRQELAARAKLYQDRGKQSFSPIHLVITDYAHLVQAWPDLRLLVKEILMCHGPLDIHLIIGLLPKDAATLELQPHNPLRMRFTYILDLQHDGQQRWIRMRHSTSERLIGIYPMPELEPVDPDETLALSA